MQQKEPSLSVQYRRVLTSILAAAQKHSRLWDHSEYIPGALPLISFSICKQDDESAYYGITKNKEGKLVFCSIEGKSQNPLRIDEKGVPVSIHMLIKQLQHYHMPIKQLRSHFLTEIEEPIRRYEMLNAGIDERVRRKLKNLDAELA